MSFCWLRSKRLTNIVIGVFVAYMIVAGTYRWAVQFPRLLNSSVMADFRTFYAAAQLVRDGRSSDLYDVEAQRSVGTPPTLQDVRATYASQPVTALIAVPLTFLPVRDAYIVWTACSLALIAASVWLVLTMMPAVPPKIRAVLVLALVSSLPLRTMLAVGQILPLSIFAMALGFSLLQRRGGASGLAMSFGLLKFQFAFGPLALLAVRRQGHALRAFVSVGAATLLASLALVGWQGMQDYGVHLGRMANDETNEYGGHVAEMHNWHGFSAGALGVFDGPLPLIGWAVAAAIAFVVANRVWSRSSVAAPVSLATCVVLAYFLSGSAHDHDMLLVWLAVCFIAEAGSQRGIAWIGPALCAVWFWWLEIRLPGLDHKQYTVFVMLGLLALLWSWPAEEGAIESSPSKTRDASGHALLPAGRLAD